MKIEIDAPCTEFPTPEVDVSLSAAGEYLLLESSGPCYTGSGMGEILEGGFLLASDGAIWNANQGSLRALAAIAASPKAEASPDYSCIKVPTCYLDFAVGLLTHTPGVALALDQSTRDLLAAESAHLDKTPNLSLFAGELMPHQDEALRWMLARTKTGDGFGLLADEMGLGKTVTASAYLAALAAELGPIRVLVVCPATVVASWVDHLARLVPSLEVITVAGSQKSRASVVNSLFNVAVTSYGCLRRDSFAYAHTWLDCVIYDEAQALKNRSAKTHVAARRVAAPRRFALTGTPVPNSVKELHGILTCLDETYLGSSRTFDARFTRPIEEENDADAANALKWLIEPCIKRRLKEDVLDLPPKQEFEVVVDFDPTEQALYQAMEADLRNKLLQMSDEAFDEQRAGILGALTRLRQLATSALAVDPNYEGMPSKLGLAAQMVVDLVGEGHGVVVYTLFVRGVIDPLADMLAERGVQSVQLTGSVPPPRRKELIARFTTGEVPAMLLTSAGGEGINLQDAADVEVLLTPWWNHALTDQAADRLHRIGQHREVRIYRLLTRGTVEERMVQLQDRKWARTGLALAQRGRSLTKMSREELLRLLGV